MPGLYQNLVRRHTVALLLAGGLLLTALGCWLDRSIEDAVTLGGAGTEGGAS